MAHLIDKDALVAEIERRLHANGAFDECGDTAWSEEDEKTLRTIISDGIRGAGLDMLQIDWLKSLKYRVQPKQEWSEEDERILREMITIFDLEDFEGYNIGKNNEDALKFLNSLKDRYTWKPSDEQMKALANALSLAKNCGEECTFDLRILYEQLKKLRKGE